MSQTAAIRRAEGDRIDYTPAAAVSAGDVVVIGGVPYIAENDIAAGVLGSLPVAGVFDVPKETGAIVAGAEVWWNPTGSPVTGTASSGAASVVPSGYLLGYAVVAAVSGDSYVNVRTTGTKKTKVQPVPAAETTTGPTLLAAELLGGIITSTQTGAVTATLDTGANLDLALPGSIVGDSFDWTLINLGSSSGAATVTPSTGHTVVGNAVVAITTSATFRTKKTAAATWVTYRLNG